jgi:hypothetical protein
MFTLLLSVAVAEEVTQEDLKAKGGSWAVEESITINAPAELVTPHLGDLSTWATWTNWTAERDPECVWDYSGEAGTVGHTMHWDGPEMGEGWVEITSVSDGEIRYDLWFNKKKGTAGKGMFEVSEADGVTTVVWSDVGKVGLMGRLFINKIETMIGEDFNVGLENVKATAEAEHTANVEEAARLKAEEDAKLAEEAAKAAEAAEAAEGEEGEAAE